MSLVQISDITDPVVAKGEATTLLRFERDGIFPRYAKEILAFYVLMEWPLVLPKAGFLRCYAALLPHGKIHVAEVFFLEQKAEETTTGNYVGTTKVFSLQLPDNLYHESLDDSLTEILWKQVSGHAAN